MNSNSEIKVKGTEIVYYLVTPFDKSWYKSVQIVNVKSYNVLFELKDLYLIQSAILLFLHDHT